MAPYIVSRPDQDPEPDRRHPPIPNEEKAIACVPYVPWRCIRCGNLKPRTYGQRGRVRYHQCPECGVFYRSVEIDPGMLSDLDLEALKEII